MSIWKRQVREGTCSYAESLNKCLKAKQLIFGWDKGQTVTLNESKLQFVRDHVPDCQPLSSWHFTCISISWAKGVTYHRQWDFKQERESALAKDVDACTLGCLHLGESHVCAMAGPDKED